MLKYFPRDCLFTLVPSYVVVVEFDAHILEKARERFSNIFNTSQL